VGSLAYTFQLYFDFSGYSDMAIGLARLFGVKLPLNFNSPYKATSIIDFWRRWHMTLSQFLRDYLYIPLGGSRKGPSRHLVNLFATMLIGGLWHGAGWTFVVWGGIHGVLLIANHLWRRLYASLGSPLGQDRWYTRSVAGLLTFLSCTLAWVFFRAGSIESAQTILSAMAGSGGIAVPASWLNLPGGVGEVMSAMGIVADPNGYVVGGGRGLMWVIVAGLIVFFMPNVQEIMALGKPALEAYPGQIKTPRFSLLRWQMSPRWAVAIGFLASCTFASLSSVSEFLYFQF
jgi:predicted membrane protein